MTIEKKPKGGRGSQAAPGGGESWVLQWLGEEELDLTEVHSQQLKRRESRCRRAARKLLKSFKGGMTAIRIKVVAVEEVRSSILFPFKDYLII